MSTRLNPALPAGAWLALVAVALVALTANVLFDPFGPHGTLGSPVPSGSTIAPGASASASASAAASFASASPSANPPGTSAPRSTAGAARTAAPAPAATPRRTSPPPPPPPTPGSRSLPDFGHIYIIVMENKEYGSIVGNPSAPYLNRLIGQYGLAANYDAVAHPSEPNYLALFSGSTQGVTDDGVYDFSGPNLADQLDAHGRSWRVFAQNAPTGCFTGSSSSGGIDGSGTYARKHEPAISFTDIAGSPARCARIQPFASFDPAAASFEFIVPNLCNDMHDCSVATGDTFLSHFVPRITGSPAFVTSVLFITWDEGGSNLGGGGRVATLVISPHVAPGTVSSVARSHYSLLRTVEDAWGLGCLDHSCQANDMREFFTR